MVRDDGRRDYQVAKVRKPKTYAWKPEHDITAYELARAMEVMFAGLMQGDCDAVYDRLPDGAKRHFEVMDQ